MDRRRPAGPGSTDSRGHTRRKTDPSPPDQDTVDRLLGGPHHDPHSVLGAHPHRDGTVVRVLRPHAEEVARGPPAATASGTRCPRCTTPGLFSGVVPGPAADYRLAVRYGERVDIVDDPYRWLPTLGEVDLHLIGEGRHERLWDVLGAHVAQLRHPGRAGHRHQLRRVGAERAGRARHRRLRRLGRLGAPDARRSAAPGCGSCSCPGIGAGTRYKFRDPRPGRPLAGQGRPDGLRAPRSRRPPRPSSTHSGHEWADGEWMTARAPRQAARRADERLRDAPRLVAAGPGLPRDRRPARRLPRRDRLHPRRAAAGGRAPVRRVLGLPGHLVLRADRAVRHPGRLPLLRRPPAPARLRRDRRLGAGALPARRVGAGQVRRHPALRARRPAPRRAARLGHARVRLRPQRGAQLPRRQRAVLARGVPHRRAARRRRRLDALPRLLPRRTGSGCPTSTAAGRTSTRWRSCRR